MGTLGEGEFGTVHKGVWQSPVGGMEVAVKQLRPGASEEEKVKFLQEAAINGQFRHPNVVKLMGVVTAGEPVSAIQAEFSFSMKYTLPMLCDPLKKVSNYYN